MPRMIASLLMAGALVAGSGEPAVAQGASWAERRGCASDGEPWSGLGVGTYHCRGGSCVVGGVYAGVSASARELVERAPGAWDFSVEPRLWEIRADGPARGVLREGDVLVAVDGMPVTTRAAGRALAEMRPGVPVELTVRRDAPASVERAGVPMGRLRVEVVPVESCARFRVSSGPQEMPSYLERTDGRVVQRDRIDRSLTPVPEGVGSARFEGAGLVLAGATAIRVDEGGDVRWRFAGEVVVADVMEGGAAARAGIVPGEVVVSADDQPLTTLEGVSTLMGAAPERPVLLFVRRGQTARQVVIHGR